MKKAFPKRTVLQTEMPTMEHQTATLSSHYAAEQSQLFHTNDGGHRADMCILDQRPVAQSSSLQQPTNGYPYPSVTSRGAV